METELAWLEPERECEAYPDEEADWGMAYCFCEEWEMAGSRCEVYPEETSLSRGCWGGRMLSVSLYRLDVSASR